MSRPSYRNVDITVPLRVEDFCGCPRGTGGAYWFALGCRPPDMDGVIEGCGNCDNIGRRYYEGVEYPGGYFVFGVLGRQVAHFDGEGLARP